jgi:hypothetical protein
VRQDVLAEELGFVGEKENNLTAAKAAKLLKDNFDANREIDVSGRNKLLVYMHDNLMIKGIHDIHVLGWRLGPDKEHSIVEPEREIVYNISPTYLSGNLIIYYNRMNELTEEVNALLKNRAKLSEKDFQTKIEDIKESKRIEALYCLQRGGDNCLSRDDKIDLSRHLIRGKKVNKSFKMLLKVGTEYILNRNSEHMVDFVERDSLKDEMDSMDEKSGITAALEKLEKDCDYGITEGEQQKPKKGKGNGPTELGTVKTSSVKGQSPPKSDQDTKVKKLSHCRSYSNNQPCL